MKRRVTWIWAVVFAVLTAAAGAYAEGGPEQIVWTKSGAFARGELVELVPGDHVTLRLTTGEIRKIPWSDVDHTSTLGSSSSQAPIPTPIPPPIPKTAGSVVIRLVGDPRAVLESRARLENGPWSVVCKAPCDVAVKVEDTELRVAGEGIAPSNRFVVEGAPAPVKIAVSPGSDDARKWGLRALFAGVPLALVGGAAIGVGVGTNLSHRSTFEGVGIATTGVGLALVLTAIPLLVAGTTNVRNAKGDSIAASSVPSWW